GGLIYSQTISNKQSLNEYLIIQGETLTSVTISGYVIGANNYGIEGVDVSFNNSGATVTTGPTGYFITSVSSGWSGTATPTKYNWTFTPDHYSFSQVVENQIGKNYYGSTSAVTISGYIKDENNAGIEGVSISFSNGGATVITGKNGYYITSVSYGWSGIATVEKVNWTFTPDHLSYTKVAANQVSKNFLGINVSQLLTEKNWSSIPNEFNVLPAYPNPFNPSTTLRYGLSKSENVQIVIYDLIGNLIAVLEDAKQHAGWHETKWTGKNQLGNNVPGGMYISKKKSVQIS
ncbi:FlgD immunoglobulin-like domain containing protein, partial [Candidatus Neomarinimicrobiota bacterium]